MKRRILTGLCLGVMVLSLVGCNDKSNSKKTEKTTEQTTEDDWDTPISEPQIDDMTIEDTEEPVGTDAGWVLGGCDRTGYAEVGADWEEHESTADGGNLYSLQYVAPEEDVLVSFVDNDYGISAVQQENVEDPADKVISAYIEQYEQAGGYNVSTDEIAMGGTVFYRTIDCIPEGGLTDYDYYLYTYVVYVYERFYTIIVEGMEVSVEEAAERIEDTFSFDGAGSGSADIGDDSGVTGIAGSSDWESYQVVIDGDSYTLPCSFSEFEANGWGIESYYQDEMIDEDDYSYIYIERNGCEASVVIANKEEGSILAEKGQVVGICIDYNLEGTVSHIAGGIEIGTDYGDVINAFGTPDDVYDDGDGYMVLTYTGEEYGDDFFSGLEITIMDGEVTEIELKHW